MKQCFRIGVYLNLRVNLCSFVVCIIQLKCVKFVGAIIQCNNIQNAHLVSWTFQRIVNCTGRSRRVTAVPPQLCKSPLSNGPRRCVDTASLGPGGPRRICEGGCTRYVIEILGSAGCRNCTNITCLTCTQNVKC